VTDLSVPAGPAAFGLFFATPAAACNTEELQASLDAARQSVASCERNLAVAATQNAALLAENRALSAENRALLTENGSLRNTLDTSSAVVRALVGALFGDRPGAEVAAAARDATRVQLDAARSAAPRDPRLRQAQRAFEDGVAVHGRGDWKLAVQTFREVYGMAERIQSEALAQSLRQR
jgi:hypothetical protein